MNNQIYYHEDQKDINPINVSNITGGGISLSSSTYYPIPDGTTSANAISVRQGLIDILKLNIGGTGFLDLITTNSPGNFDGHIAILSNNSDHHRILNKEISFPAGNDLFSADPSDVIYLVFSNSSSSNQDIEFGINYNPQNYFTSTSCDPLNFSLGDIDIDCDVDVNDIVMMVNIIFEDYGDGIPDDSINSPSFSNIIFCTSDMNSNGITNINDIVILVEDILYN